MWEFGDPVDSGDWRPRQFEMVRQLLPHLRQFVAVRHALVEARAVGTSLAGLLDVTGTGVMHLDRRGRIVAANDSAVGLLRQRDVLIYKDDVLRAVYPADDAKLQLLLERALPQFGGHGAGGSMSVGRSLLPPRYVLHVNPVGGRSTDFEIRRVAALVLVRDSARKWCVEADHVASTLRLTPTEGSIAVMLANGSSRNEIAAAMGRELSTIDWHLKHIYRKHRISRQADLVRLVLSVSSVPLPKG